jgi:hypothetical protein
MLWMKSFDRPNVSSSGVEYGLGARAGVLTVDAGPSLYCYVKNVTLTTHLSLHFEHSHSSLSTKRNDNDARAQMPASSRALFTCGPLLSNASNIKRKHPLAEAFGRTDKGEFLLGT